MLLDSIVKQNKISFVAKLDIDIFNSTLLGIFQLCWILCSGQLMNESAALSSIFLKHLPFQRLRLHFILRNTKVSIKILLSFYYIIFFHDSRKTRRLWLSVQFSHPAVSSTLGYSSRSKNRWNRTASLEMRKTFSAVEDSSGQRFPRTY